MGRSLRIDYPGARHHIVNRGVRRQPIFLDDEDRRTFLWLLGRISSRFDIRVDAYALMGNHYHLLLGTPSGGLSDALQYLDGQYARRFNDRHRVDGPLFKGRFLSKLIDSDSYLESAVRYIHRNPIEADLVDKLEEYEWSSYPAFLGVVQAPAWLSRDAIEMVGLGEPSALRRMTDRPLSPPDINAMDGSTAAIGSASFVEEALRQAPSNPSTEAHRRESRPRVPIDVLDHLVATHRPVARASNGRSVVVQERWIHVGLAQELSGMRLAEIAERYGFGSANSAGSAAWRFRQLLASDAEVRAAVDSLIKRCSSFG